MRSHFVRGKPTVTHEQVRRAFEDILPSEDNLFIRPLKLSELPPEANLTLRYWGAFDGDGNCAHYECGKKRLLRVLAGYAVVVHAVH